MNMNADVGHVLCNIGVVGIHSSIPMYAIAVTAAINESVMIN